MSGWITPTQRAHIDKAKAIMSMRYLPQEVKDQLHGAADDTMIGLALLDHCLQGFKGLGITKRHGFKEDIFELIPDTSTPQLSADEMRAYQLGEVQRVLAIEGEDLPAQKTWTPDEEQFLRDALRKHIVTGSINEVGRLGTAGRVHALDYPDPELAGKPIPVYWVEGQQNARGEELLMQHLNMVNSRTGAGLYGVDLDAMHDEAAGHNPGKIASVANIFLGARSLNQAEGIRAGEELKKAREKRRNRLVKEDFEAEHGPHDFRTMDAQTKADNKLWDEMQRGL